MPVGVPGVCGIHEGIRRGARQAVAALRPCGKNNLGRRGREGEARQVPAVRLLPGGLPVGRGHSRRVFEGAGNLRKIPRALAREKADLPRHALQPEAVFAPRRSFRAVQGARHAQAERRPQNNALSAALPADRRQAASGAPARNRAPKVRRLRFPRRKKRNQSAVLRRLHGRQSVPERH